MLFKQKIGSRMHYETTVLAARPVPIMGTLSNLRMNCFHRKGYRRKSMKKALLLLTGGRGVPDMLVVKYLKPDIIFNLTTETGRGNAENLKKLAEEKFHCTMEILPPIHLSSETDVEAEQEIKEACIQALQREPEAEWTMHFTSAPKIVGIYAHDVARDHKIPYWFLETSGKKVVSMVTVSPVN